MLVLAHAGVLAGQLLSAWWTGFAQDIRQSGAHGSTLTLALVGANQLLWSVGIHGGKVLDHWLPDLYVPAGQAFDPALAWRPLIDNFVHLGGSGATLGLALALLLAVRAGPQCRLAQVSLLPSLLNINELLVFGLPVVLQPLYLLPFVGVPLLLAGMTLAVVHLGGLPLLPVNLPWTTPPLLSGWLLTGSAWGAALQLAGIGLSVLLYLPFVRRVEHARQQRQAQSLLDAHREILVDRNRHQPSLRRRDHVGDIARGLLEDLKADLRAPGGATALALVYQPQHDRQGRAVGVEALLRWTHPRFGAIRADVAVALAEQGGLIRELGLQVLDRACACKAVWNRRGLQAATMSVNVSPLQLDDPSFATLVAGTLGRHGLRPGELELEVTESHAVPMDLTLDRNMTQLAAMGVRVAMDDFGMGHSSLLHLRRFRVHAIKIDGSLTPRPAGATRPAPTSCAPSPRWAVRSGWTWWPSSSRSRPSATCWPSWAATCSRVTCSARRWRPTPAPSTCCGTAVQATEVKRQPSVELVRVAALEGLVEVA
jgi:EAL domain-containing protein (putative c-di-GMP-specific phosphodiesterase class I)